MPKLVLYHAAPSRSSIVHWMLEELGQPYELHMISFKKGENRQPAYLAVNPMGKVPALKHGETVITEAAAICTYLADVFPQAGLNIPVGDPRRGTFPRKEPPQRAALGFGDFDTVVDVLAKAAAAAQPYLLGNTFTAADVVIGSGLRWGTMFKLLPERAEFKPYMAALAERPALRRATEKDAALQKAQEAGS
jgi:glutathione S-transferase